MAKLKISRFRHPSETSRFLFAMLVVLPLSLVALAYIILTIGLILIPIIGIFLIARNVVHARFLGNSIRVGEHNFPQIQALADEVRETIGYKKPIEIFIYEDGSFNAMLVPWLKRRAVVLNSELVEGASDTELKWIIGRFVGYLSGKKSRLMIFEVFLNSFERLILFNMFLYPYERAAVLSGDRIGAHAAGNDAAEILSAMKKLFVGPGLANRIDAAGIAAQNRELRAKSFFSVLARLYSPFPHMTRRFAEMQKYLAAVSAPASEKSAKLESAPAVNEFMAPAPPPTPAAADKGDNDVDEAPPVAAKEQADIDPELFSDTVTADHGPNEDSQSPWPSPPVAAAERAALQPTIYKTSVDEDDQPAPMANEQPIMLDVGKPERSAEKIAAEVREEAALKRLGGRVAEPGWIRLLVSLALGAAFYVATDFFLFGSEVSLPGTLTYWHQALLELPVMTAILWGVGLSACLIARLVSGRRIAPWILLTLLMGWTGFVIYLEVQQGSFYLDDILPLMVTGSLMFASAALLTTLLPKSRQLVSA